MKRLLTELMSVLRGPDEVGNSGGSGVLRLLGFTLLCGSFYGGVMGSFGGLSDGRYWQVLISGVKVPLLLLGSFAVSLPSFFVLNTLLGVRDDFPRALRGLASSQSCLTIVLAALAPYTLLWYASFADYASAILFNGIMFAVATLAAQWLVRRWYRPLIGSNPRHRLLLWIWVVLYSFVAIQMAWVLRPFVGQPSMPVQFFRDEAWGNAYVMVAGVIREMFGR